MKTFKDLDSKPRDYTVGSFTGNQARMEFDNGYGVSVINYGYGRDEGLYELAIMRDDGLCYDTPITNDVLGYLTEEDVTKYMRLVQLLPKKEDTE